MADTNTPRSSIGWKELLIVGGVLLLGLGFAQYSTRASLNAQIATLEQTLETLTQEVTEFRKASQDQTGRLSSDLELVTQRVGVTADELATARQQLAQRISQQQKQVEAKLEAELATKANTTEVDTWKEEAATRLAEVRQDADTRFGNVSGEVTVVKQDLATTRQDLSRQLGEVRTSLSDGIARNAAELAQLRMKGERNYVEVDIHKNQKPQYLRVGDVQVALTKADVKGQKYNIAIQVDDRKIEKKDRTINEPVQFLVGRDQIRYELVINSVEKDRIQGYMSTPKDRVLSAEGPTLR
jgi:chromosome segregation ATPase